MAFTFKQVFGLVIFKKSYFQLIQANSKASYEELQAENNRLKSLLEQTPEYVGDDKLLSRIKTLQDIVKEERKVIKEQEIQLRFNATTMKSNNYLIRDLWETLKSFKSKRAVLTDKELIKCQKQLIDCESKSKTVETSLRKIVTDIEVKLAPKETKVSPKSLIRFKPVYA